jgi:hypothetical protein
MKNAKIPLPRPSLFGDGGSPAARCADIQGSARLCDIEALLIERGVIVSYEASHAGAAS